MIQKYKKQLIFALALVLSWAGFYCEGRQHAPTKVQYQDKVVYQDRVVYKDRIVTVEHTTENKDTQDDRVAHKHTVTTTKEITKPDGTTEKTTVIDTDVDSSRNKKTDVDLITNTKTDQKLDISKTEKVSQEVKLQQSFERSDWRVSGMVAVDLTHLDIPRLMADPRHNLVFGVEVDRRIIWNVSVGIFGLTNGTAGLTLSLEF